MTIPTVPAGASSVGKYDIIATPIPYSLICLRYAYSSMASASGRRQGLPSESDCKFLESPPVVPPLVPFQYVYRPGARRGHPSRTNEALRLLARSSPTAWRFRNELESASRGGSAPGLDRLDLVHDAVHPRDDGPVRAGLGEVDARSLHQLVRIVGAAGTEHRLR